MTHIIPESFAPDFSLKGLDGKTYSLGSLTEHGPVVLVFFKVSCPVCQFTFPFLERLYQRYGGGGVSFLAVGQDDAKTTSQFLTRYAITFPTVLDEDHYPVSNAYGLTNVPTLFVVENGNRASLVSMGFDKKGLEDIAKLLAEHKHIVAAPVFRANETVPDHKPG